MPRFREPETVLTRLLECLNDLYSQIVLEGDSQPRVMYTVMGYHLTITVCGALQREGILERNGQHYKWIGPKPTQRMAIQVRESYLAIHHEYFPPKGVKVQRRRKK